MKFKTEANFTYLMPFFLFISLLEQPRRQLIANNITVLLPPVTKSISDAPIHVVTPALPTSSELLSIDISGSGAGDKVAPRGRIAWITHPTAPSTPTSISTTYKTRSIRPKFTEHTTAGKDGFRSLLSSFVLVRRFGEVSSYAQNF